MSLPKDLMNLVYPRRCAGCNEVILRESYLCGSCSKKLVFNNKPCLKCGGAKKECRCARNVYRFAGCVAPIVNDKDGIGKQCIRNYKIGGNGEIADFFAEHIAAAVKKHFAEIPFGAVAFVPVTFSKEDRKGYDHGKILAEKVAAKLDLKCENMLIKRTGHTQHTRGYKARFEDVHGVFKPNGERNYENVLLIDDMITTGATLNECTRELMFAGVKNVYCAAAVTVGLAK